LNGTQTRLADIYSTNVLLPLSVGLHPLFGET